MDSYYIYQKAEELIRRFHTRRFDELAEILGINVQNTPDLKDLLGMYTCVIGKDVIILNSNLSGPMREMVAQHELGHSRLHRHLIEAGGFMQEFTLFQMRSASEYEANAFAAHMLLDSDEVCDLARQGYDVVQLSQIMQVDINLMLIKLQELGKLGFPVSAPIQADSRFFRRIHADQADYSDQFS